MIQLIWLIPLLPLLGFIINGLGRNILSKPVAGIIGSTVVFAAFVMSVLAFVELQGSNEKAFTLLLFDWISAGSLNVPLSFLYDPLSAMMLLIITGVGFLIHIYSIGYMQADSGFAKFFSYLNLFIFFMLLLVLGSNYLVMFIGWEGVGLCSYLLIGFWYTNDSYASAAKKAFVVNRIGDLGFIIGVFFILSTFGSIEFAHIFPAASAMMPGNATIGWICFLLFIGACGKSAQLPLFTWLPDAMAGPTPVSALIHAATMVTAGVYMIARSSILFDLAPYVQHIIAVVGLATALIAAMIAVSQTDIKKVLAYSTVSQLGYMFLGLGVGAYTGSFFHVITHAMFKALLFLGAGSVIHAMHHGQDMREMGGLKKKMPVTFATMLIATIAISGIPPFSGFFSKDEILAHVYEYDKLMWFLGIFGAMLTAFYMFRMLFLTFFNTYRGTHHAEDKIHESPATMKIPLIILAFFSAVAGMIGIPEVLGGKHWLSAWLAPAVSKGSELGLDHATEWVLMSVSVLSALVAIAVAYYKYISKREVPLADAAERPVLTRWSYRKFYFDELYDFLFVRPLNAFSTFFYRIFDKKIIDGLVNGSGFTASETSKGLRLLQTGNVGFYIFMMVLGIISLLLYTYLSL